MTDGQSVCLGIEHACGTCDQILLPIGMLQSKICGLISVRREGGSAICSVITQWFELHRTHNHTLLSHLRLPQPGVPGSHIYVPRYILREQDGPVQSHVTTDLLCSFLNCSVVCSCMFSFLMALISCTVYEVVGVLYDVILCGFHRWQVVTM
jgi:hypothetical protein